MHLHKTYIYKLTLRPLCIRPQANVYNVYIDRRICFFYYIKFHEEKLSTTKLLG